MTFWDMFAHVSVKLCFKSLVPRHFRRSHLQEFRYRKQIARQLRTQYVGGSIVTP